MPTSAINGKHVASQVIENLAHRTILRKFVDIGVGNGCLFNIFGPSVPDSFWTGVEAWAPYVNEFGLDQRYDKIFVSDARVFDLTLVDGSDVILFGDVLEHMTAGEACRLVDRALDRCRFAYMSIPIGHWPQDAVGGNPFERHVDLDWTQRLVEQVFPNIVFSHVDFLNPDSGVGVFFAAREKRDAALLKSITANVVTDPMLISRKREEFDFCPNWLDQNTLDMYRKSVESLSE